MPYFLSSFTGRLQGENSFPYTVQSVMMSYNTDICMYTHTYAHRYKGDSASEIHDDVGNKKQASTSVHSDNLCTVLCFSHDPEFCIFIIQEERGYTEL